MLGIPKRMRGRDDILARIESGATRYSKLLRTVDEETLAHLKKIIQ